MHPHNHLSLLNPALDTFTCRVYVPVFRALFQQYDSPNTTWFLAVSLPYTLRLRSACVYVSVSDHDSLRRYRWRLFICLLAALTLRVLHISSFSTCS